MVLRPIQSAAEPIDFSAEKHVYTSCMKVESGIVMQFSFVPNPTLAATSSA